MVDSVTCPNCGQDPRCTARPPMRRACHSCNATLPDDRLAGSVDVAVGESDGPTETVLLEAQRIVFGARQGTYGHPRDDFARIAVLWASYLAAKYGGSATVEPEDVSAMMILLKMARLMETPTHRDSIVDIAGYAETMARVVGVDA